MLVCFDYFLPDSGLSHNNNSRSSGGDLSCSECHRTELLWDWRVSAEYAIFPKLNSDKTVMRSASFMMPRLRL